MKKLFIINLILGASLSANAGDRAGGGGMGVVCRNPDQSIKSVELLDLWEGRTLRDQKIISSSKSVKEQTFEAISRSRNVINNPYGYSQLLGADALEKSLQMGADFFITPNYLNVKRLRGVKLTLTKDAFEEGIPANCQLEQLVKYNDVGFGGGSDRILVNQDLVDHMDNTNQAALALHESLYAFMRNFGEKTSVRVRRAVSYVFSGQSFKPLASFLKEEHITCESKDEMMTRLHFVTQKFRGAADVITVVPEIVFGLPVMGYEKGSSGMILEMKELFSQLSEMNGSGMGIGLSNSPVDFDLSMRYRVLNGTVNVMLDYSPSGITAPQTTKVYCKLIE